MCDIKPTTEIQYFCQNCDSAFVVYHPEPVVHNTHCGWCHQPVYRTGRIGVIEDEGQRAVTYQFGRVLRTRCIQERFRMTKNLNEKK